MVQKPSATLVAEIGNVTTRVSLVDLVDGEARLIGQAAVPSTTEPPYENAIHLLPARTQAIRPASGVCCILYRLAGMPISYAEMMRGSDIREVTISRDHGRLHHSRWELFAEFLEKGVIRRARMLSILVPREHDIESARAACNALERRPLPLTT